MRLDLSALRVRVGDRLLLDRVSLQVAAGRVVGLVGPNGSGKSTLIRTIARIQRPDGGAVLLDGADVRTHSARQVARSLALLAQDSPPEVEFTVFEMVSLGRLPHQSPLAGATDADHVIVEAALARVGVLDLAGRGWSTLSGGERQRALLARALAQQTPLLLLDEPTNHLDIGYQLELLAMTRRLGVTVLAALHDLNLAARFCDEVIVLHDGAVVGYGPPAQVLREEVLGPVFGVTVDRVAHPRTGELHLLFGPRSNAPAGEPANLLPIRGIHSPVAKICRPVTCSAVPSPDREDPTR